MAAQINKEIELSSKLAAWLLMGIFLTSTLCAFSGAQDSSSGKQQPSAPLPVPRPEAPIPQNPNSAIKSNEEKKIERQEQSQRILGVLPEFGVTSRQNAPPLTSGDKFHLFARSAFDPVSIAVVGLQAGLSQAQDEFPAYGQGAQGYGKRFGASLADEVSSGFWSNYFYPVVLKEDPRYFRLGEGRFGARLTYSFKQEFVCHTDKGGRFFNLSNVLGAFTSGAISNAYYPGRSLIRTIPATATTPAVPVYENDRGAVLTLSRAAIAIGYGTIGGIFDEFWPDIHHRLFERHKTLPDGTSNR